jgi:hypothetical protein
MTASSGRTTRNGLLCAFGWAALLAAQPARADATSERDAARPSQSQRERLLRCAREWDERKRSGEAGALTWRRFWTECQKR